MTGQAADAALLIVVIGLALASVVQAVTDPRISRDFLRRSLVALAFYAVHTAVGIVLLIFVVPQDVAPWGLGVALVGWLGLGALGLIRMAPRLREPPRRLMRFGAVDVACLAMVAVGLAAATGLL